MNLIQAAADGDLFEVARALGRGEPINMTDVAGFTAMHWAAMRGHKKIIRLLKLKGANIEQLATNLKLTPLHMAALANQPEALEELLAVGAQIEAKNLHGKTSLDMAILVNRHADLVSLFLKAIPGLEIIEKLDRGYEAIHHLLQHGAIVHGDNDLSDVVCDALIHDRVDILAMALDRGFDCASLNDEDSLKLGFDYVTLLTTSNFSVNCLRLLQLRDSQLFSPKANSFGALLNTNILIWVNQQMPDREIFTAPGEFLQNQEEAVPKNELNKYLPACLQDCDVNFSFDKAINKYYISKITYGLHVIYFDSNGQVKNLDDKLDRLMQTLAFLREQGVNVNHCDLTGMTPAMHLIRCPAILIKQFVDAGIHFTAQDLWLAIRKATPDVVRVLVEADAAIETKNEVGQNALDLLLSADNDQLLNERPELIRIFKSKLSSIEQLEKSFAKLSLDEQNLPYEPQNEFSYHKTLLNQYGSKNMKRFLARSQDRQAGVSPKGVLM